MSALDKLIEKDELTKGEDISFLELAILEISKKMPRIAEKSAAELAAKDAAIEAARKYVGSDDNMNGYRYGVLVKALAALRE